MSGDGPAATGGGDGRRAAAARWEAARLQLSPSFWGGIGLPLFLSRCSPLKEPAAARQRPSDGARGGPPARKSRGGRGGRGCPRRGRPPQLFARLPRPPLRPSLSIARLPSRPGGAQTRRAGALSTRHDHGTVARPVRGPAATRGRERDPKAASSLCAWWCCPLSSISSLLSLSLSQRLTSTPSAPSTGPIESMGRSSGVIVSGFPGEGGGRVARGAKKRPLL